MLIHYEESATTKTAPFRRNPMGAGGFGPQALSFVGHDEKTSFRSSLRACNPKTPARGPRDFCHGLLRNRHPFLQFFKPIQDDVDSGGGRPRQYGSSVYLEILIRTRAVCPRLSIPVSKYGDGVQW